MLQTVNVNVKYFGIRAVPVAMVFVPAQIEVDGGIAQAGQIILHYSEPGIPRTDPRICLCCELWDTCLCRGSVLEKH